MTQCIPDLLVTTAAETLGTMFFTPVTGRLKGAYFSTAANATTVRIPFLTGSQTNGHMDLRVSEDGAQWIASSFLAIDEGPVPEHRVNDVICEVANVTCGSLLSTLFSDRGFRLLSPEVLRNPPAENSESESFEEALELERGWLSLHLHLSSPA